MSTEQLAISRAKNLISVTELKRLLIEINEKRPDICFRYRPLGEMWAKHFMHILRVTERGTLLKGENLLFLPDLSIIMQFELDAPFQGFQPYFHYNVQAFPDL